jgi:hypothetical protein
MKSVLFVALALLAVGVTGCSTVESRPSAVRGPRQVALFLTVNGTDKPTPDQLAAVQKALAPLFATQGWVLVEAESRGADPLRVDLSTNPDHPESPGILTILGLGLNPLSAIAARAARPGVYYPSGIYDPYYDRAYYNRGTYDRHDHRPWTEPSSGSGGTYTPPPSTPSAPPSPPPSYSSTPSEGRSWGAGAMRNDPPPSAPPPPPAAPSPSYDSGGGRSWGAGAMRSDPPPPPPAPPPPAPAPAPVVETPPDTPAT